MPSYFFSLSGRLCIFDTSPCSFSASAFLVYMHPGWYLIQQSISYWKLPFVIAGGTYRSKYKMCGCILDLSFYFAFVSYSILALPFHWGASPRSSIILSTPRVSCVAGISYILPSKQYPPSLVLNYLCTRKDVISAHLINSRNFFPAMSGTRTMLFLCQWCWFNTGLKYFLAVGGGVISSITGIWTAACFCLLR
jgi:hypothetical protein